VNPDLDSRAALGYTSSVASVAPSVLSADFGRLAEEVRAVTAAGADLIHVDVMDGHFVPPITIGPRVVAAIRTATSLPLDVHLMIEHPERQVAEFVRAGADGITVHVEAGDDTAAVLAAIREAGVRPGLALNPPTPLERVRPFVGLIDLLLVMSVNPGWGGQAFVEGSLAKLGAAASLRRETGARFVIEVDGGVKPENAAAITAAGADVLVAGSAIFESSDYAATIRALRGPSRPGGG
jgi:ribulose-phosphate 3-epimerase